MRYRWFAKDRKTEDEFGLPLSRAAEETEEEPEEGPEEEQGKIHFSRVELTVLLLATVIMCYSLYSGDIPVFFFTLSVLILLLRKLTQLLNHPQADTISNVLKGFGISLFIGAFFLAFM